MCLVGMFEKLCLVFTLEITGGAVVVEELCEGEHRPLAGREVWATPSSLPPTSFPGRRVIHVVRIVIQTFICKIS